MTEKKTEAAQDDEQRLSTQAQFSTYKVNKDLPETLPAPGQHVVQELGVPKE